MDQKDLDALLDRINFELDPIYVIAIGHQKKDWYLEKMEFGDDLVRKVYWTKLQMEAMHFHDYDDVLRFATSQFGEKVVTIKELL